jgi:hypothetical protein
MPINFIAEDGTGKSDATSYATLAQFTQFWTDRGVATQTIGDSVVQAYLNQATDYIDSHYDFIGVPTYADTQALEWPRYISEQSGLQRKVIDNNEIPLALIKAVCWLAYEAKKGQLEKVKNNVIQESYSGISKTYSEAGNPINYEYVDTLLSNYLISGTPLQRVN